MYICGLRLRFYLFFFFNDTATTEIYTLSLHDALPISAVVSTLGGVGVTALLPILAVATLIGFVRAPAFLSIALRSEEHTSELQSRLHLVCRLLLEKKKKQT